MGSHYFRNRIWKAIPIGPKNRENTEFGIQIWGYVVNKLKLYISDVQNFYKREKSFV